MGSCSRNTSVRRHRYVSWCVDPVEPLAPEAAGTPEEAFSQIHQTSDSVSIPHVVLTPPETIRSLSQQPPQPAHTKKKHQEQVSEGPDSPESEHPEDKSLLLPRSSPVIHRRHRPVSWTGGTTDTSNPTSLDSLSPSSGSLDQRSGLRFSSSEDLRSCPHVSPRCSSVSSHNSREKRISGIPEFSANILKTSCDLEKENSHFIVVDMVLEVLEGVKWTLMTDTHCQTCANTQRRSAEEEPPHRHTHSCGLRHREEEKLQHKRSEEEEIPPNTHSFYQHTQEEEEAEHPPKTFSVLSTDSGFEDCGFDSTFTTKDSLRGAEALAQQLVLEFKRSWMPSHGPLRGRLSLRSSLQELPGTDHVVSVSSSSLKEEIRQRTRMRGSLSWAPPRLEIIFTIQPSHRRSDVVALQNFLCAGCGTEVDHKYIKKLRYCDYLGQYFCDCCHCGSESVIPARVLSSWDFSRCPVSDFSKQLLDSVWFQPLFDLSCVGKSLYGRVKELDRFRELQEQLLGIKKLLRSCRLSEGVLAEFEQLPAHLTEQPHLFSMDDLLRVKKGQLVVQARAVLQAAICHVETCQLCLARGFICEFCREKDVIFPFQTDICRRCPACRACFHKLCFVAKKCPKCVRIQSRKKRQDRWMN